MHNSKGKKMKVLYWAIALVCFFCNSIACGQVLYALVVRPEHIYGEHYKNI